MLSLGCLQAVTRGEQLASDEGLRKELKCRVCLRLMYAFVGQAKQTDIPSHNFNASNRRFLVICRLKLDPLSIHYTAFVLLNTRGCCQYCNFLCC